MYLLAFNTKDPNIPKSRWIASLNSGETVFENIIPGSTSAWIRLKQYLKDKKLKITRLRYQLRDGQVINMPPGDDVDGYWSIKKITSFAGSNFKSESTEVGIGYIKNNTVYITWIKPDNNIYTDTRKFNLTDIGNILHEI